MLFACYLTCYFARYLLYFFTCYFIHYLTRYLVCFSACCLIYYSSKELQSEYSGLLMGKDAWPGARRQHAGLPYLAGTCVTDKQRPISSSCLSLWESLARLVNAKQFVIGEQSGVGEDGACTGRSSNRSRDSCMDRLGQCTARRRCMG
jgi:hypothetical protein